MPARYKTPAAHNVLILAFMLRQAKIYKGLLYLSLIILGIMRYLEIQFKIPFIGDLAHIVSGYGSHPVSSREYSNLDS